MKWRRKGKNKKKKREKNLDDITANIHDHIQVVKVVHIYYHKNVEQSMDRIGDLPGIDK